MNRDSHEERIEAGLREAWQQNRSPEIPDGWRNNVMDAVRDVTPESDFDVKRNAIHRLMMKSAVACACIAAMFGVFLPASLSGYSEELVRIVMLDPAGILRLLPIGY